MVISTTIVTVPPDKRAEYLQTVSRLVGPIKGAKGCLMFTLYIDGADENSTLLVGEWETESDLNTYLRSKEFAILRGAIKVLSNGCIDTRALITMRTWITESPKQYVAPPVSTLRDNEAPFIPADNFVTT
jgi:quinol monooxygenase YgiN